MEYIYIIAILFLLYLLVSKSMYNVLKPLTSRQKKVYSEYTLYEKESFDFNRFQHNIASKLPIINIGQEQEEILRNKIERLGLDITTTDLRRLQLLYALTALVIGLLLLVFVNVIVGIVMIAISILAWKYPMMVIDKKIEKRNEAVRRGIPDLYSVLYYTYKRSPGADLTQKIRSYMKNADEDFYKELQLFVNDARNGEDYALRQFKKRVPIGIVIRFCDILETRLEGYDNTAVMANFKNEMDEKKIEMEDKILNDLDKKISAINWIGIMIPFTMIMIVYFAAQIITGVSGTGI